MVRFLSGHRGLCTPLAHVAPNHEDWDAVVDEARLDSEHPALHPPISHCAMVPCGARLHFDCAPGVDHAHRRGARGNVPDQRPSH